MDWALPNGNVCFIDELDLPIMAQFRWRSVFIAGITYVVTNVRKGDRRVTAYLHRIIMRPPPGVHIDHIDHDGLNNQRSNLRLCSRSENMRNQVKRRRATSSRFKGVSRAGHRWCAQLEIDGKHIRLGSHDTEEQAAAAYNAGAVLYFGSFAHVNALPSETT